MTENNERAKFSLADGRIEIEGSEAFVAQQLAKLEPLLQTMFERRSAPSDSNAPEFSPQVSFPKTVSHGLDNYQNLFALADGKVQILKSLSGSGKAAKSFNAALLLTFANELIGTKSTSIDEVRTICTSHACLDAGNFSKIFRNAGGKECFTISSGNISLTHPGRTKAKALADLLNK